MTLREMLRFGEDYLTRRGIADASVDAWLLLEHVTGLSRAQYLAQAAEPLDGFCGDLFHKYQELLEQRGRHIPLQHLTGEQEFMGLTFLVNEHVLVPRQDTETLVEEALARLRPGMCVLDLCTGSGCIAVSLAKLGPEYLARKAAEDDSWKICVDASDILTEALAVARENAKRLGAQIRFIESDLFAEISGEYDMIVSNPPYIRTAEIGELSEEVRLHEPLQALDGAEDGLRFYREIVRQSPAHLAKDGCLLFEIGYDQAEAVRELMEKAGFGEIRVVRDLAGHDRVIEGRKIHV